MVAALVVAGLIVLAVLWIVAIYNRLVGLRNRHKNAFAQIDVQLRRRYDLIPNLVETARAYMKHEAETLEAVIAARNGAAAAEKRAAADPGNAAAMRGLGAAEAVLGGAMGRFLAVAEQYPDLKANQTMSQLMEELTSTENRVAFARQAYNDAVMAYNTTREQFPNTLLAAPFKFDETPLLEAVDEERQREAPRVSFN